MWLILRQVWRCSVPNRLRTRALSAQCAQSRTHWHTTMATMALSSAASALGSHALHARSPRRLARLPSGAPSGLRLVCNAERRTKFNGRPEEPGDLLLQSAPCPVPREQQPSQELLALQVGHAAGTAVQCTEPQQSVKPDVRDAHSLPRQGSDCNAYDTRLQLAHRPQRQPHWPPGCYSVLVCAHGSHARAQGRLPTESCAWSPCRRHFSSTGPV